MSIHKPIYLSPEQRRQMARPLSQSHIKFIENDLPKESINASFFKPIKIDPVNKASLIAELNYINSNRPRIFMQTYKTFEYDIDRKVRQKYKGCG